MMCGWGSQLCAAAPNPLSSACSAALAGAGLAARLTVLVALVTGLLTVGRLAAAAGLTALTPGPTIHGAAHAGGQR